MRDWPHFPEDQLSLPMMPEPVVRKEREDLTKGGRITERSTTIDRRRPCPKCGCPKTDGLPCPNCAEDRNNSAQGGTFRFCADTE